MVSNAFIVPDWPAPDAVRAYSTTRAGGVSTGVWSSLNLSTDVGDDPAAVAHNRVHVRAELQLPSEPCWLKQVHGSCVVDWDRTDPIKRPKADAGTTTQPGVVCAVLTADCLPVLLCDVQATRVAAVHAGWRGLAAGVIESALSTFASTIGVMAWLGPAIGPESFEVGDDVRDAFLGADPETSPAFHAHGSGKWYTDLYALARHRLQRAGVTQVYGGGACTLRDARRYYSYRRDGITGRMATLIWISSGN